MRATGRARQSHAYGVGYDAARDLADGDGDQLRSKTSGGLDPDDGTADKDGDGLSDRYELSIGLDPAQADSDADGLSDYWELFYHTRPLQPDTDFDGLPDGAEFFHPSALHAGETDNGHWQGGWSYVYYFDDNNHPIATYVSASPLSADTDGDGILDEREKLYGFNPNVQSALNVLSLNMNTGASRVQPGATVDYTASIHNDLRAMYEDGLLQTEFPVDHLVSTRELGVIDPRETISLTGQVAAPSQVNNSQAMSLTVRAGVVVEPGPGRALLLRMNDPAGSTVFRDASYNDHNASCTTAGCPQANENYTTFDGSSGLSVDIGSWQDFLNSSTDRSFTVNIKVMGGEHTDTRTIFNWDPFSIKENGTTGLLVDMDMIPYTTIKAHYPFQWTKRWSNVTLTYDASTRNYLLYLNGTQQGTHYLNGVETNSQALGGQPNLSNQVTIGHQTIDCTFNICAPAAFEWSGSVDQFEIFPRVLDAQTIRALYGPKSSAVNADNRTLDLQFDEPPGQDRFTNISGGVGEANCAWLAKSCPDSGIPGRDNQALRFDGGVADVEHAQLLANWADDGNDGVGDYLQISADTTNLGLYDSSFTVMAWIRPDNNLSGDRAIMGNDGGSEFESLMLSLRNGTPRMAFGGSHSTASASSPLSPEQWHHVAFRYDKDARQQVIFVNGQQVGSSGGRNAYMGTNPILVGRARGGAYFDGLIDDLVIVKQVLSPYEIQLVMNRTPLLNLHLDEDLATTTFVDDSPSQRHAMCQGDSCPDAGAKGQIREAPVFDGGDRLTMAADSTLNRQLDFSIALWVKPTKINRHVQTLIQKHDGSGSASNFHVWTLPNSLKFKFDLQPDSSCTNDGVRHIFSNGALLKDQWNHIVVTFDGYTLTIYLNGSEDSSATFGIALACTTGNTVTIGNNFVGSIDEVTVYDALFSADEVRSLYDYQSAWYDTTVQQLVTIDADNPTVAIGQDGQYLPAESTFLAVYAADATSEIEQLEVSADFFDGASHTQMTLPVSQSASSSGVWLADLAPAGPGEYTVQATATDSVGHTTTTNGVIHIDGTSPNATLDANLAGATLGGSDMVILSGTVDDSGISSSGVAPNTVVVDLRDANGVSLGSIQHAEVQGNLWQAEYPIPDAIVGSYNVWASASDHVGNVYSNTIGAILLDDVAPVASVDSIPNVITQTGTVISGAISDLDTASQEIVTAAGTQATHTTAVKSAQFRFRHASGSIWSQLDPAVGEQVVFYVPFDTQPYIDLSAQGRSIETIGSSSDALLFDGRYGGSIFFRGESALSVPNSPAFDFDQGSFSVAAWIYFESFRPGYLINRYSHGNDAPGWFLRMNANASITFDVVADGSTFATATTDFFLDAYEWHHLVAVVDVDAAQIRLYVDGSLASTAPWSGNISSSEPLFIGSNGVPSNPSYFNGAMDDLVIFDQALTHGEAGLLAQAETWRPVTLTEENAAATAWQYEVTDELEGPYKIDLWTEDTLGNRRYIPNVWSGEIDPLAPRLALQYVLSNDKNTVQVSCAAADYNLTHDGWSCPVDAASLIEHYKNAHWFTTIFSNTQKLAGLSTAIETFTPGPGISMTACDSFGNCTTAAPADTDSDGIPDHVEGEGDRDGDGILDAHDYDPDGHFYALGTGTIIPGGSITVTGPGQVIIGRDGSDGYYEWVTDGTPGLYTMQVTPPSGYRVSPDCPAQPGPIGPAGDQPIFLGASEVMATMTLANATCEANPYYLTFSLERDDPFIFNNNIPLAERDPTTLPPAQQPGAEGTTFLPIVGSNAQVSTSGSVIPDGNIIAEKEIFLPLIAD